MKKIQQQFDEPAGHICRAIESCRTWSQLETAYKWGTDVVLSIGDHIARTEKPDIVKFATEYKQIVLRRIKDCFVKQRNQIEDVPGVEYINVREIPEHVSVCRTCSGNGFLMEPAYHSCTVCDGSGRVNITTTVRTIITPFRAVEET